VYKQFAEIQETYENSVSSRTSSKQNTTASSKLKKFKSMVDQEKRRENQSTREKILQNQMEALDDKISYTDHQREK